MSTTAVPVNDDLLGILGGEGADPARALQEAAVLDLYRRAVVSAGRAAELLGMAKWDFVRWAGVMGVAAVRMSPGEFEDEIATAGADLPRATTR